MESVDKVILEWMILESASNPKVDFYVSRKQLIEKFGLPPDEAALAADSFPAECEDAQADQDAVAQWDAEEAAAQVDVMASDLEAETQQLQAESGYDGLDLSDLGIFAQPAAPKPAPAAREQRKQPKAGASRPAKKAKAKPSAKAISSS